MIRMTLGLALLTAPAFSAAGVIKLECTGTSPTGAKQTIAVSYDDVENWVDDNGTIRMRDGVSAYYLKGIKVMVDKETMEYATRETTAGEKFKGTCRRLETKS